KFEDLKKDIEKLYKWYESQLSKIEESVRRQFEQEKKRESKNNQSKSKEKEGRKNNEEQTSSDKLAINDLLYKPRKLSIIRKILQPRIERTQLTEEERQEIEDRLDRCDYSQLQIQLISKFEEELKKEYENDRSKRELELNKEFLKKLDESMNNDKLLPCVIKECQNNVLQGSIGTRLKPVQHLAFAFGNFVTQDSRPNHLKLKQVIQRNNDFDIRGNEELVFAYGLASNEIVLVLSIDRNVSEALLMDEEIKVDNNEIAKKQSVWSENYNQNCITKIFLSSRQTLPKKKSSRRIARQNDIGCFERAKTLYGVVRTCKQVIHVYKWGERIVDSLQKVNNKTITLNESVLPQDFYVTSMCFNNKDDSLYILDNKNTIRCIELDTGLYRHESEIVCKEQYSKIMTTLEGGYIVGIKPHEQEEEKEKEKEKEKEQQKKIPTVPVLMQSNCDLDEMIEENVQAFDKLSRKNDKLGNTDTEEEDIQILGSELITTTSSLVKRAPTGLVQCDFYVLDDSNELVRSLVLPKEFTSNGIHNIQFKLILQHQIYIVFLDSQFVLQCLPLHVSLKKSQLHVELISMHGNSTASDDQIIRSKKLSKLNYIEYKFYSLPKLTLHLSVLLD
ncbi:hypothetical protein RFI_32137, partial [Reticulomyxa filosa]